MTKPCPACNELVAEDQLNPVCAPCEEQGLRPYSAERYRTFVQVLRVEGLTLWHYHGRWFYKGPAVTVECNEVEQVEAMLNGIGIRVQLDKMGYGYVVYPQ